MAFLLMVMRADMVSLAKMRHTQKF
jgi:hypothetical protein